VRIAELRLQLERQGPSKEEVTIARANYERVIEEERLAEYDLELQRQYIRLAELDLEQLNQEIDPRLAKEMERAELAVERLRRMVDNTRINSPIAGKVTSLSAYDGRAIDAYRPVFVVADESELEITAEPMSSQLQDLSEGMSAGIILSSYPGKELPAQIVQLPYPFGGGGGVSLEEADKLTHITFDPLDLELEPGDLVKVLVTLERKEDVLWLPPAAISVFAGRRFVIVEEDGRQRRVDVTIGIQSSERMEIKEGVEEGQVVVGQ
jgi:multidrug efflux pump subunit AcrA (membrane-fusion protein)